MKGLMKGQINDRASGIFMSDDCIKSLCFNIFERANKRANRAVPDFEFSLINEGGGETVILNEVKDDTVNDTANGNAAYRIDKMMKWEQLTGGKVGFDTTLVSPTITFWFGKRLSDQVGDQASDQVNISESQQNDNLEGIISEWRYKWCS